MGVEELEISYEEVVTEKLVVKTGSHEGEGESVIESGRMDSWKILERDKCGCRQKRETE